MKVEEFKRWEWNLDCGGYDEDPRGDFVRYDDVADALAAHHGDRT